MAENREKRSTEYQKKIALCEKYQLDALAEEFREGRLEGEEFRNRIEASLRGNLKLYYQNRQICEEVMETTCRKVDECYAAMKKELLDYMDAQYDKLGREQTLTAMWLKCGTNLSVYGELLSYQIKESGVKEYCEELIREYQRRLRALVREAIIRLSWYRQDTSVESVCPMEWKRVQYTDDEDVSLADDFLLRLFQTANSFGFGNAVRLLTGARLLQKAIDIGQKALMWYLDSCSEQCNRHLSGWRDGCRESFRDSMLDAYQVQTGIRLEQVTDVLWEIEHDMTEAGIWQDVMYRPVRHSGRLVFLQSLYYLQVENPQAGQQEICNWAENTVIVPYYEELVGEARIQMIQALLGYQGAEAVSMPRIRQGADTFEDNGELTKYIPYIHRIEWGEACREAVQEIYQTQRRSFQEWCVQGWEERCKIREQEILRSSVQWFEKLFEKEVRSFLDEWNQWRAACAATAATAGMTNGYPGPYYMEPDYFTYYQWYYYPVHPTEHTLRFLLEFRQTGQISGYLTRQVNCVDTRGRSLRKEILDQIRQLFAAYLEQLEDVRRRGPVSPVAAGQT